jgi:drug/metabolite transporter (DMT)-like permease
MSPEPFQKRSTPSIVLTKGSTYIQLIGASMMWAFAFVVGRYVSNFSAPIAMALFRFLVASAVLWAWLGISGQSIPLPARGRAVWVALGLGLTGACLYTVGLLNALHDISAGRASLILSLNPIVVLLVSSLLERRAPARVSAAGILLSFLGVSFALTQGWQRLDGDTFQIGDLWMLFCIVCWCSYTLLLRISSRYFSSIAATAYTSWSAVLFLLPMALFEGQILRSAQGGWPVWLGSFQLGALATVLAATWYSNGVRRLGPVQAIIFMNLIPVFALSADVWLFDLQPHWSLWVGALMVISGVTFAQFGGKSSKLKGDTST